MACYYSQGNIQPATVTTFHLKVLTEFFVPMGLQLASQMRLQKAFTDVAIHRTSRGLTTIWCFGWRHISQPQSLWIYQLNPNSLFSLPDVCRNHHINIPKRCSPLVLLHLAPPVSRQVLGAVVQDSQNLTNKKNVGAADIVLQANLTKIFLIYINVQLTSEKCEYDTMYIPMRIFLWGKKKTQHHRHSPSENSHLETGGRIEEEQQQSSHIPLS